MNCFNIFEYGLNNFFSLLNLVVKEHKTSSISKLAASCTNLLFKNTMLMKDNLQIIFNSLYQKKVIFHERITLLCEVVIQNIFHK